MSIGSEFAKIIYDEIRNKINSNQKPTLTVVQVGDDQASSVYIKHKRLACEKLDFGFEHHVFDKNITTSKLINKIDTLNKNINVTGIIVQLPLPQHIDKYLILNSVDVKKDVDCLHEINIGKLCLGYDHALFIPATAYGIYRLIKHYHIETKGKCCVIVGKSEIVGKPTQLLMSNEMGASSTTIHCDKNTINISQYIKMADILIVATGKHHLINNPDDIKEGCVVIDVGIHRVNVNGKNMLQGDVDYHKIKDKCSLITPVPGGIGPITVACLMYNVAKPFMKDKKLNFTV